MHLYSALKMMLVNMPQIYMLMIVYTHLGFGVFLKEI